MNTKRILIGGLVAGLVMNVLDFVTNAMVFGPSWAAAYEKLGLSSQNPAIPAFWISFDFVLGVLLAFLYAAMRPRLGPGPRTGAIAGVFAWSLIHLTLLSHLFDGVFPAKVLLGTAALELGSEVVGGLVAGRLYAE